jgi:hypothetical protein
MLPKDIHCKRCGEFLFCGQAVAGQDYHKHLEDCVEYLAKQVAKLTSRLDTIKKYGREGEE